jgi:hypothetical protein
MRGWWGSGLAFALLVAACGGPEELPRVRRDGRWRLAYAQTTPLPVE